MAEKIKFKIGLPTFVFFGVLILYDFNILSAIPFFSALLHELGHIIAMVLCGDSITSVKILPFGVDIKKAPRLSSYKQDIIVTGAGIFVNIICLVTCIFLPKNKAVDIFAISNLLLMFINILPIKSLDGGQLLEKFLLLKYDSETAERVTDITSFIFILILGSFAIWLLFSTSYNFTLLLMCVYLFCGIFIK